MAAVGDGATTSPDELDFGKIMSLMNSKYTVELTDRHVMAIRKVCKVCCNGFLLKHLEPLVELLRLAVQRLSEGSEDFAAAICDFTRIASQPFVSCKASDMITYGHHLPPFIKVLVSTLNYALPLVDDGAVPLDDPEARRLFEERRSMRERVRIEVAHTLACWSRFGLDEDSVESRPNRPLTQAVADSGTPNLRILRQAQVMDALSASFRAEDSPEAIVITLGTIRDMSLYRPLARQITNCGLLSNLVHVIRVNLLGSDVLLVAAEVLWNVLELDWEGAAEALGQAEVMESFRDFMDAVLSRGYRFKDKIFRNDMMVLLMYISKRVENRPLFAQTGLMALLLSHMVSEPQRKALKEAGILDELINTAGVPGSTWPLPGGPVQSSGVGVTLTNSPEDMAFRTLLWGTLARCCSSELCAEVAVKCGFVPSLLSYLDAQDVPDQRQWSQEQRRKVQLEALSAFFLLVQYVPAAFVEAQGNAVVCRLLLMTRSCEVQKRCLHLLQIAVRMGPEIVEELGQMGAVGMLIEIFCDMDNPMGNRQLCASVLAGLCANSPDNCREFRKKDGVEAIRGEVVYRPDETTENHLFYTLCIVDCVWSAIVGTRKNEMRFLDAGGLFALLDVLEVAPLLLKRQIIGCLADLMRYRKAAKLFSQWSSQVTMKGAHKIMLELWQSEQEAAGSVAKDGVIRDLDRPLNPQMQEPSNVIDEYGGRPASGGSDSSQGERSSRLAMELQHAREFAESAASKASPPSTAGTRPAAQVGTKKGQDGASGITVVGTASAPRQDCRAKIYAVLSCVGFECQEALGMAERQQMELVKLYPDAVDLETWIKVRESLEAKNLKPVSADQKWIEDAIAEREGQASRVRGVQRDLANERQSEEQASLSRFYEDIRGRAQFRRTASAPRSSETSPAGGEGADGASAASHRAGEQSRVPSSEFGV